MMVVWWALVLGLLVVAASPVLALRPGRRVREVDQLRQAARARGIAVEILTSDWPYWMQRAPRGCARYYKMRASSDAHASPHSQAYWQPQPGVWCDACQIACTDDRLMSVLAQLPEDVYRVEITSAVVALDWGEVGGEPALGRLENVLGRLLIHH